MRIFLMSTALISGCLLLISAARAERPLQPPKDATLVVSGTIEKITPKEQKFGNDGVLTTYIADVKVDKVERGKDVKPGDTVSVRWFHVTKRPSEPLPGAYGQKFDVKAKDSVRVYLIKEQKGDNYNVIYNREGMELLKTEK